MAQAILIVLIMAGNMFIIAAGWQHPEESNMASFMLWLIISTAYLFSSWKLKLPLSLGVAFIIGNILLISCALLRGGYTFNLGPAEYIALFSVIIGITCWAAYGTIRKKWDARLLLLGTIAADVLSFYPQNKQYFGPNEAPSYLLFLGMGTWVFSMAFNIVFIDKFFQNMFDGKEKRWSILLNSTVSIENFCLLLVTIWVISG